ncbi:MAG: amidohydrolase [Rubellimicrobium sp.]|nr:amidohydrolase [Rubellimicrobium sp.]
MDLHPDALRLANRMRDWRQRLHMIPEGGFEEVETARFVAEQLRGFGLDPVTGVAGTGIVVTIEGRGGPGPVIGLRAELDALPMTEAGHAAHASRRAGWMHGCGHDGHMAMLLGTACALAEAPGFAGTLRLIFQPAEEGLGGAKAMLADGLFTRFPCDEIYALHNTEWPLGQVGVHHGAVAAAADRFEIVVHGSGGHAAAPHLACDPIPVAARILLAIEALPGRLTDCRDPAVVTVGAFHAGEAFNTIPATATLVGTVRTLSRATQDSIEAAARRIARAEADAVGARVEIAWERPFAPTINSAAQADTVIAVAREVVGEENLLVDPPPELGSEDFCFMLEERPGCYFLLGQADDAHTAVTHDVHYDFNDEALVIGTSLWLRLVEHRLGGR